MEVKTGNPSNDGQKKVRDGHVGQLSLYTLLMSSRYKDVTEGLLYYVRYSIFSNHLWIVLITFSCLGRITGKNVLLSP
jgi:hypothetical protein